MNKTVLICSVVAVFCAAFSAAEPEKLVVSLRSLGGENIPRVCNVASCDNSCRNIGWQGGVCINGECFCWKYTFSAVEEKKQVVPLKSLGVEEAPRACNASGCNTACKRIPGWKGGVCINGECYCWK